MRSVVVRIAAGASAMGTTRPNPSASSNLRRCAGFSSGSCTLRIPAAVQVIPQVPIAVVNVADPCPPARPWAALPPGRVGSGRTAGSVDIRFTRPGARPG